MPALGILMRGRIVLHGRQLPLCQLDGRMETLD